MSKSTTYLFFCVFGARCVALLCGEDSVENNGRQLMMWFSSLICGVVVAFRDLNNMMNEQVEALGQENETLKENVDHLGDAVNGWVCLVSMYFWSLCRTSFNIFFVDTSEREDYKSSKAIFQHWQNRTEKMWIKWLIWWKKAKKFQTSNRCVVTLFPINALFQYWLINFSCVQQIYFFSGVCFSAGKSRHYCHSLECIRY